MKTIYKYTSDGKKVVVIGKLNAEETIVQEVFISNGNEIPSGENFVVKSLHDAPSESWKDAQIRKTEENYDRQTKEWARKLKATEARLCEAEWKASHRADALWEFSEKSEDHGLDLLFDFMAGKVTHFAFLSSYSPAIRTLGDDDIYCVDNYYGKKIEKLKLFTLWGDSKGNLQYKISSYSDGSGYSHEVVPCRSRDEAIEKLQEYFDELCEKHMDESDHYSISLEKWQELEGIHIPENVLKKYKAEKVKSMTEGIKKLKIEVEKAESELESLA